MKRTNDLIERTVMASLLLLAALFIQTPANADDGNVLRLATTTSTQNSGLLGDILKGEMTYGEAGDRLMEVILRTCNGRLTAAEALGHREFVLTKLYRSA